MTFKSLSDFIYFNDTLFNKMHGLSIYPSFETIKQLKSQKYRVDMALFNSPEVCNLTLY